MTFDALVTPSRDGQLFTFEFPEGWEQGRGLFGGLVVAAMIRAVEAVAPGRKLRSLTSEIFAPVPPGRTQVVVEVLREGNAVTTAAARMVQGQEVFAHVVAVLGKKRELTLPAPIEGALTRPTPPGWHEVEVIPVQAPIAPVFAQHFEFRPTGDFPFSGSTSKHVTGWVKHQQPGEVNDAALLAGLVDAHWPVMQLSQTELRPMSTIAFTFQPIDVAAFDASKPVFHRATLVAYDEGYCVENRELWSPEGTLLALNQQTFVVIK